MSFVALLDCGKLPVVLAEEFAALRRAARATVPVPQVPVFLEIPGPVIQRYFLARPDIASGAKRDLVVQPAIGIAGMIQILIQARRGVAVRQRQEQIVAHLPDGALAVEFGGDILAR